MQLLEPDGPLLRAATYEPILIDVQKFLERFKVMGPEFDSGTSEAEFIRNSGEDLNAWRTKVTREAASGADLKLDEHDAPTG